MYQIKCTINLISIHYLVLLIILILIVVLGPNKNTDFDTKIQRLIDMGIECDQARGALSTYNWDLERATEQLFS